MTKPAPEQFTEVGADPTLDEAMQREHDAILREDPGAMSPERRRRLVEILRQQRAMFHVKGQRKDDEDD